MSRIKSQKYVSIQVIEAIDDLYAWNSPSPPRLVTFLNPACMSQY